MTDIIHHVPKILINRMQATITILQKTEAFLEENGMTEVQLLNSRLAPDMLPLSKQIQIMSDNAKGAVARLQGITPPSYEDNEATVADLIKRLEKTIEFVKQHSKLVTEEALKVKVSFPWMPGKTLTAIDYVVEYLIPNFHFHATIAYGILRNLGMKLGKSDYLSQISFE